MTITSTTRWHVVQRYENFVTGVRWTRRHAKAYRTWRGARAAAQRLCWTTMPNATTRIDSSLADVVEATAATESAFGKCNV